MESVPVHAISEVIQLAVAPVFLLTGIAGFLSVLTHRLSRVIDRTRQVGRRIREVDDADTRTHLCREAKILKRRNRIINWALRLSVGSALVICMVVITLFVDDLALHNLGTGIAYLFVAAMLLVSTSLLLLIVEVSLSTRTTQLDVEQMLIEAHTNG